VPLTPYGLREWLLILCLTAALMVGSVALQWWWPAALIAVAGVALLSFFRDPIRRIPADLEPGDMLSPADGMISAVERVDHHVATDGPALILRIYLSVLDVHVNRAPFDGEVRSLVHTPGRHLDVRIPESAHVNESNVITLAISNGETIGVKQIAGKVARRIVCPLAVGDRLRRGQKFGMIKFGSTTELILPRPDDVKVHVAVGQKVYGGLTRLATLPLRPAAAADASDAHPA